MLKTYGPPIKICPKLPNNAKVTGDGDKETNVSMPYFLRKPS